jgi:hypothetical protein
VILNRTPEGEPFRCPTCGGLVVVEPSWPSSDVPCHHCGLVLWSKLASVSGPASEKLGPDVVAGNIVARDVVAAALCALPEPEADVLRHFLAGRSFESIGQELGLSREEVGGIWARGVKRLEAEFERNS